MKKDDPLTNIEDIADQRIAESDWMTVMSDNAHQKNILIFFFPSCLPVCGKLKLSDH